MNFEEFHRELVEHKTALANALDRDARAAELVAAMAPFQEGEPWQFAPDSARAETQEKVKKAQDKRAGQALHSLRSFLDRERPHVDAAIEQTRRAPNAEEAHLRRNPKATGLSMETSLQLQTLDELRQQRLRAELSASPPSEVLQRYRAALDDDTEQGNATLIRLIEGGAHGRSTSDTAEVVAGHELRQTVTAIRDTRIPVVARDALQAVNDATALIARASTVNDIRPIPADLS